MQGRAEEEKKGEGKVKTEREEIGRVRRMGEMEGAA